MRITSSVWECITYLTNLLSFSGIHLTSDQQPLPGIINRPLTDGHNDPGYPIFKPPGGRQKYNDSDFLCEYPDMKGWEFCSVPGDRECWLRHPDGRRFDIHTDYENNAPHGKDRYYELEVTDGEYNADGLIAKDVKLINNQYPGPWIQACWGDRVIINVTNKLQWNGTAIHWHGIRQNFTMHMDGVPGITQCPIKPNDYFVYNFTALQYGSSWYHSHYSVQYADGTLGPMTLHGPSTGNYDEAKPPLLMTDWFHNSAFYVITQKKNFAAGFPTILLNGTGNVTNFFPNITPHDMPPKYQLHFEPRSINPPKRARRYLLRLINTSFTTGFVFSIDHHMLTVVSADFVAIVPYSRTHIFIGIGQRYNVIVEADPVSYGEGFEEAGNYWIRTKVAECFRDKVLGVNNEDRNGILRYRRDSSSDPNTTRWSDIPDKPPCRDEIPKDIEPRVPWYVGKPPANGLASEWGERFDATVKEKGGTEKFPLAAWSLEPNKAPAWNPLQIDYKNPTFLNLDNLEKSKHFVDWPKSWVVVPENYTAKDWVRFLQWQHCFTDIFFTGLPGSSGCSRQELCCPPGKW